MIRFQRNLMLLIFICATLGLAQAQTGESFNYKLQLLTAQNDPGKYILSSNSWGKFLDGATILEEVEGNAELEKPIYILPGYKKPMAYFDPRPGRQQVQYIDVGLKMDLAVRPASGNFLKVESRAQQSILAPHPKLEERHKTCLFESTTYLRRGQTAVFLSVRGPLAAKHLKQLYPEANITENTHFIMALSLD